MRLCDISGGTSFSYWYLVRPGLATGIVVSVSSVRVAVDVIGTGAVCAVVTTPSTVVLASVAAPGLCHSMWLWDCVVSVYESVDFVYGVTSVIPFVGSSASVIVRGWAGLESAGILVVSSASVVPSASGGAAVAGSSAARVLV